MTAILFVCMGNICRSPLAEGAMRALAEDKGVADKLTLDSAGTIDYHAGKAPDSRGQQAAQNAGFDISGLRARKVTTADFETFDLILAMDRDNLAYLEDRKPDDSKAMLKLFLTYAPHLKLDEMPDPYYGHARDFAIVANAAQDACSGLLQALNL